GSLRIVPLDLNLYVERFELLVIICIGEVVAASLAGSGLAVSGGGGHRALSEDESDANGGGAISISSEMYKLNGLIVLMSALVKEVIYFDITEHLGTPAAQTFDARD
ncbi:hypothetical protein ScalyP_jg10423, partial [Parmales sp. scaly parma]